MYFADKISSVAFCIMKINFCYLLKTFRQGNDSVRFFFWFFSRINASAITIPTTLPYMPTLDRKKYFIFFYKKTNSGMGQHLLLNYFSIHLFFYDYPIKVLPVLCVFYPIFSQSPVLYTLDSFPLFLRVI